MALEDELTDIHGIGEAKASEIMEVVREQSETDSEATEAITNALDYMDQGDYGYAEKFLRRVVE